MNFAAHNPERNDLFLFQLKKSPSQNDYESRKHKLKRLFARSSERKYQKVIREESEAFDNS